MFLYVITNLVNGKQYVGITGDPEQRRREHFSGHGSRLVWNAIRKYGRENLLFEVWYESDKQWITTMECRAIVMLGTYAKRGYNLTLGGESNVGRKFTEESRRKMSLAHIGRRSGAFGRKHTPQARQRMSASHRVNPVRLMGDKNPMYGMTDAKSPVAKAVLVDGKQFDSMTAAAAWLGISPGALWNRFSRFRKSGRWPDGYKDFQT